MENSPTVIFLGYFENLQEVVPSLRRVCASLKSKPIVATLNFDTSPLAVFSDLKVIYFDELLQAEDYKFMDNYIFNLTQTWYSELMPTEGITQYKGIQFGKIVEEKAHRFFTFTIKNTEIILKIIEHFKPEKIILIGKLDIFQCLSVFIKKELNIDALFIKADNRRNILKEAIGHLPDYIIRIACYLCDNFMKEILIRRKKEKGIFIDFRLYSELKDLEKEHALYLYIIEKGLRIRLKFIKDWKTPFAPVLADGFLKRIFFFDPFYRYWRSIKLDTKFQNKFNYKNLPIWIILESFIRESIIYNFSRTEENVRFLEKLYQFLKPRLVVLREDVRPAERAIVLTARQFGIPTLFIQHGILAARGVYTKVLSDKVALWGNAGIEWYGRYGNDISKCRITGKIGHDVLYYRKDSYRKEHQNFFSRIGVDPDKEVILYIANHFKKPRYLNYVYLYQDSEYVALNSILNIANRFSEKQFIIKIHPFDPIDINVLINKLKGYTNVFTVKDIDLWALINYSSLVITSLFSSVALDAVILDKPVITLNFYKREDLVPFAQRGVAISVIRQKDLYQTVKQIFEDKDLLNHLAYNRGSFIYDYAYRIDGKSRERVLNLIRGLYKESVASV